MTCTICGRYAEPDPETGYDVDGECQFCSMLVNSVSNRNKVDPIESDLHDLGSVLASLADLVKDCHDPAKLFDVYIELGKIAKATMGLQDAVGRKMDNSAEDESLKWAAEGEDNGPRW